MPPEWEIWLDTHISLAIAKWMAEYTGFTVKSSYILSLQELDDIIIYQKAKEYGNVIVLSKDTDVVKRYRFWRFDKQAWLSAEINQLKDRKLRQ